MPSCISNLPCCRNGTQLHRTVHLAVSFTAVFVLIGLLRLALTGIDRAIQWINPGLDLILYYVLIAAGRTIWLAGMAISYLRSAMFLWMLTALDTIGVVDMP